ncbi:S8 family serine peptidase [Corynebacterium sp. 335C]
MRARGRGAGRGAAVAVAAVLATAVPGAFPPQAHAQVRCTGTAPADAAALRRPTPADERLRLREARELADGSGVVVAVVDTGVADHPRLGGVADAGDHHGGGALHDCDAHGTFVAGVIATRPGPDAVVGVAPGAQMASVRQPVGDDHDLATLAAAVDSALAAGARVINVSLASCAPAGAEPPGAAEVRDAVARAEAAGAVVVAASGNRGADCRDGAVAWPAVLDEVVAVTAVAHPRPAGAAAAPAEWALTGPWVDVAAPGGPVTGPDPRGDGLAGALVSAGGETPVAGTSFAAPVVAGVAALVLSRAPHLSPAQVREALVATATPAGPGLGAGVVDPAAAVSWPDAAAAPPPAPADPPPAPTPADDGPARRLGLVAAVLAAAGAAALAWRGLSAPAARRPG